MCRYLYSIPCLVAVLLHCIVPALGQLDVEGAVFAEECYNNILEADIDNNGRIVQGEFLLFAQLQGPAGIIDDVLTYAQLPAEYRAVFTTLACLCSDPVFGGNPGTPNCCVDDQTIRVPGPPEDTQTDEDLRLLFAICALTDSAAREVINSEPPTVAPIGDPTFAPSNSPTPLLTLLPTRVPTNGPTGTPTFGPTESPVVNPTDSPSAAPTLGSTVTPTNAPTSLPTSMPTGLPTYPPTIAPTTETGLPTIPPTSAPTSFPTISPAPTEQPTSIPTDEPTISPAPTSAPTTATPSSSPTVAPTVEPLDILTFVNYTVAFLDGKDATDLQDYYSDLVVGMDKVSDTVAANIWGQRRLQADVVSVRAKRPTRILEQTSVDCNPEFTDENDLCQLIRAEITLQAVGQIDVDEAKLTYQSELFNAIYDGELQDELDAIDSNILVITGLDDPIQNSSNDDPNEDNSDEGTLSSGAIGGLVIGAILFVALPVCFFLYTRSRANNEAEMKREAMYQQQEVAEVQEEKPSEIEPVSVDTSLYTDAAVYGSNSREPAALGAGTAVYNIDSDALGIGTANARPASTLGASPPDYGRASRRAVEAMEAGEDIVAEPGMDLQPDSSSNAGSSGWSSSAGLSSYNTGSLDDSTDAAAAAGATLAAIGVSSNLSRKLEAERKKDGGTSTAASGGRVTREQLDSLIETGDWAAVGATAALLAAASDSQSQSSRSVARSRPGSTTSGSIDAARAAELDHLVEAGDWEGVVLAAARFEASDAAGSRGSRSGQSIDSASATDSATGGATGSSPSVSESLTASDDPSKVKKRAEIRGEVEALVRRVVPEEIDNVDEMMNQFKGREEELVETLRTMQERAVAQKARAAGHRAAKQEARRSVQRGVVPGTTGVKPDTLEQGETTLAAGQIVGGDSPKSGVGSSASSAAGSEATGGSQQQVRSALEEAIDAGDWDAVGRAAAMMSDASTASTGEIDRFAANLSVSSGGTGSRSSRGGLTASRAAEIDEMIDRGDWTGVVAAANRFSNSDKKATKSVRTKEEEEALAQAEKWSRIAQQKAAEGATDAAASEAAEWAIQRSLSQMKQAEKDKEAAAAANEDEDEV